MNPMARVGLEGVEPEPLVLECVLDACGTEVVQDHVAELVRAVGGDLQPQLRVAHFGTLLFFFDADRPMRRQAFHGERPRDPDSLGFLVGLVIEHLGVGLAGDGGVDFSLPVLMSLPPFLQQLFCISWPVRFWFAGHFPFFPLLLELLIQLDADWFQRLLPLGVDGVDLLVVSDGFERDVGHPLVDEALANVAFRRWQSTRRQLARQLGVFRDAFGRVGQQVVGKASRHQAGPGQGQRHAAGVDGDPSPAPLLGDVGRCSAAARWVQD